MSECHVAQLNFGRPLHALHDPRMAGFMDALAERSSGFVWRLKDDSNDATALRPFADSAMLVVFGWRWPPRIKLWMSQKCG